MDKVELTNMKLWLENRVKQDEIDKYLVDGQDFIPDEEIEEVLKKHIDPDPERVREILQKSLSIKTLDPDEVATLIHVTDPALIQEMRETAAQVKKKVYDNRVVTFAPLYMGNYCVNNCAYCGFKTHNTGMQRRMLTVDEVKKETEVLAGTIGHKRLIVVYGEHPKTDVDYMVDTIRTIYNVKVPTKNGHGCIRRVNVNAAPLAIDDCKKLREVGIGTYQIFQETYHKKTYGEMHPENTVKGNYLWRLYGMHRAMEAGIDDVGLGALFGLYDWKFEVMALTYHARELERVFGVGPHTISFPRLEPAADSCVTEDSPYAVSDEDFLKLILVIRLAVPHTGMIITARESAAIRREAIQIGCTQTDASTKIGIGAYSERGDAETGQEKDKQQFELGDTRTLDEVIREFAELGYITSFCTAGYRCGRTGECIMDMLKTGAEGKLCKLNAVLTFREWLDDFASPETKEAGERIIQQEIDEIRAQVPKVFDQLMAYYERTKKGERDLYF